MTVIALNETSLFPAELADRRTQLIIEALDDEFLASIRWDWDQRVVFFPAEHLVLSRPACAIAECTNPANHGRLCSACRRRWQLSSLDMDDFIGSAARNWRCVGQSPCQVPKCERPRRTEKCGLCDPHYAQQEHRGLSLEEFLQRPDLSPIRRIGPCAVVACYRDRDSPRHNYCKAHRNRYTEARRAGTLGDDEESWRRTSSAIPVSGQVSFRGLPLLLVAEILYGFQLRTKECVRTLDQTLRRLCDRARSLGLTTVLGWDIDDLHVSERALTRGIQRVCSRVGATPETERLKDVWDLTVFGLSGTVSFTEIRQTWLREATKLWAANDLGRRRGTRAHAIHGAVRRHVLSMERLSECLWLQREDHGLDHTRFSRNDVINLCNRLGYLMQQEELSAGMRHTTTLHIRKILNWCRTSGMTRPGQPLEGLPPDFAITPDDIPDIPEDTEAGKDLPDEVMRQLCANLHQLEASSSREVRVCVEILIDTGRRPDEAAMLRWDCLTTDPDGTPILLYDNAKANRPGRRLPIAKETAALITAQQERVRERFPETPVAELALLPSPRANPEGRKPIGNIGPAHRNWVDALPYFLLPIEVLENGQPTIKMLPFDKSRIFPYAHRHSYAQRHADAGVRVEVLKVLMDHRLLSTTQGYYQITDDRRRAAVDRVTAMQFDRHGNRVWRKVQGLLESEHVRRAIGEVAVPYGVCLEPSNVAAGGHSCPIRFRCVGCDHFRTDVSYLPDLHAYLADLLRSRERLRSAFEADDWARSEAMPSEEEIARVRRLIERVKADLDGLSPEERAQIEAAVTNVRRGRPVMLGMPTRISQPLPDVRPGRPA